jgi:hypothetical protein
MLSTYYGHWEYWELYQKITFDPELRLIYVNEGVTSLDIRTEVYSAWKDWFKLADNSGAAPPALRTIGGDDTTGNERAGDIYFLINNWRIVYDPRLVQVTGVLFSDDYDTPWLAQNGETRGTSGDEYNPVYPAVVASLVTTIKVQDGFPQAAEIADAVWDELAADHVISESMGEYQQTGGTPVVDNGAIADAVRTELTPELANMDAAVSSRATQASVDAIQVDITNLGTFIDELLKYQKNKSVIDPVAFTLTIYDDDGITPIRVFDLKDQNGIASVESIFQRIPQ